MFDFCWLDKKQDQTFFSSFRIRLEVCQVVATAPDRLEERPSSYSHICTVNEIIKLRHQIFDAVVCIWSQGGTNFTIDRIEDNGVQLPAEMSVWLANVQPAGAILSMQIKGSKR